MKKSIKAIVAILVVGGAFSVGYKSHGEDRLLVESLFLPDYLSSSYPGIAHISKDGPISRTVSKDEYIKWLEQAVQTVRTEEQLKGVQYGTEKVSELIESIREQASDPNRQVSPVSTNELLKEYGMVFAKSLLTIKCNQSGLSVDPVDPEIIKRCREALKTVQ